MILSGDLLKNSWIVIPTHNEEGNIEKLITLISEVSPDSKILIVDDNSTDETRVILRHLAAKFDNLSTLLRPQKLGLGPAYLAGFEYALKNGAEAIVQMDADLSHSPNDIPRLLSGLRDYDLVIGSRWISGGKVKGWPLKRLLISRAGNIYAKVLLRSKIRDLTGGFKAHGRRPLELVTSDGASSGGYAFQIEINKKYESLGMRVLEIPIVFCERETGYSKMSFSIVLEAMKNVTRWGLMPKGSSRRQRDERHMP